jgi:hypothetical protein
MIPIGWSFFPCPIIVKLLLRRSGYPDSLGQPSYFPFYTIDHPTTITSNKEAVDISMVAVDMANPRIPIDTATPGGKF